MSPTEDQLLSTASVRRRYDDVSHMWVERRLNDDPSFPRPLYIAKRRFWRLGDLVEWERGLASRPRKPGVEVAA
jgi:hypothetical protein